jgi:hypothetical protein
MPTRSVNRDDYAALRSGRSADEEYREHTHREVHVHAGLQRAGDDQGDSHDVQ